MFFIFWPVISPIKWFYALQDAQLDVVIGQCHSGLVWWSAIGFYHVSLEFLGRCWCQHGHVDSESHFLPLSFVIICWFKQRNSFLTVCCFHICSSWVLNFVWRQIFHFLFANFFILFSILEFLKIFTNFLLPSYVRKFWLFLSELSQCALNFPKITHFFTICYLSFSMKFT